MSSTPTHYADPPVDSATLTRTADQTARYLEKSIISVQQLLNDQALSIPEYQRPYKWSVRNITQLFSDIAKHKDKSSYRLGTVVFHEEDGLKNIVDGQQRTITLLLIARAYLNKCRDKVTHKRLEKTLNALADGGMIDPEFDSKISQWNIHQNYLEICRLVSRSDFTEETMLFLLEKCEVVTFSLSSVSEAFQFFDSQNARGRDLEPHDLLKAYHLREFTDGDDELKASTVAQWEDSDTKELTNLFALYLYRIRNWSKGSSARYFGKNDTDLFKGVNMEKIANYPYVEQLRMSHHFVDHYNQQYERAIDHNKLNFPFHLDQIIINGRRFFEMISHYQSKVKGIRHADEALPALLKEANLDESAKKILGTLNSYPGRDRTGDRYARCIFDCLLLYYLDKFGTVDISRAIEKVFIWSYSLRLQMQKLQLSSMDNYVLNSGNLFKVIKEATYPHDFLSSPLPVQPANNSSNTEALEKLFKEMGYYE